MVGHPLWRTEAQPRQSDPLPHAESITPEPPHRELAPIPAGREGHRAVRNDGEGRRRRRRRRLFAPTVDVRGVAACRRAAARSGPARPLAQLDSAPLLRRRR